MSIVKAATLETLMEEWNKDVIIDETELDRESLKQSMLHAKWLNWLSLYKMKALTLQKKIGETKGLLARYYNGYMTKQELESIGREQYRNKTPLKSELERMMDADPLLTDLNLKFEINIVLAEYCEHVIKSIRDRGFSIQTAVEWKKFSSGM